MKTKRRWPLLSGICVLASASMVASYWFRWGRPDFNNVWDWILLLAAPIALMLIAVEFMHISRKDGRKIAADHAREIALQAYFESMTKLLLEQNLLASQAGDEVFTMAHSRTVTVLPQLDAKRKFRLVQFLCESQLIAFMDLQGADLQEINLSHMALSGANFSGANLSKADFGKTIVSRADFTKANLSEANLSGADLSKARLQGTYLIGAKLEGAYLSTADLGYAILSGANLSEANLTGANLSKADLSYADLRRANLIVADLSRANLTEADLREASLSGADLNGTNMNEVDLTGANLRNTYLSMEQLTQAKGLEEYTQEARF